MDFDASTANPATDGVRVFASIGSLADIHDAVRDRFEALELSRAAIDHAAGLADGHASKLLARPPIKRFADLSLFATLEAAGLRLALIEDPAALAQAQGYEKRVRHKVRCKPAGTRRMLAASRPTVLRELATKGGKARMARLTPAGRHRLAKLAAKARWSPTSRRSSRKKTSRSSATASTSRYRTRT
jgi:hypothetical protein